MNKLLECELKTQHEVAYWDIFETNSYCVQKEDIENKNIVDIGSNRGFFSIYCQQFRPKNILAFEANENVFRILESNIKWYFNIKAFNFAVFDNGTKKVKIINRDVHSTVFYFFDDIEKIEVQCISLSRILEMDEIIEDNEIVVKMDCEGSEFEIILDTPIEVFKKIKTLFIEIHGNFHSEKPQYTGLYLVDYLKSIGYNCFVCSDEHGDGFRTNQVFKFVRAEDGFVNFQKKRRIV